MGRCKHVMAANLCLSRVGFAFRLSACAHALCIVRLSIDGGHSAILSSTGVLYTFGSGATGELGHGSEVTELVPEAGGAEAQAQAGADAEVGLDKLLPTEVSSLVRQGLFVCEVVCGENYMAAACLLPCGRGGSY